MRGLLRYAKRLLFLCVGFTIFCMILVTFLIFLGKKANKELAEKTEHEQRIKKELLRNEQVSPYLIILQFFFFN